MAYDNDQKEYPLPNNGKGNQKSVALLPKYFRTQTNQKFLESTLDQMVQPGVAEKLNGFVGRKESKAFVADDSYISEISNDRENYQLEPSLVIKDELGNYTFRKDYIDYVNQISNFGGNSQNQNSLNAQEYYAWNPNIDLDKVVNFREYYWLPNGPQIISIAGQSRGVQSTYTVDLFNNADNLAYIFSPDGQTQLPSLTLYRGQTYTFEINSEGFPFTIKTKKTLDPEFNYDDGVSAQGVEKGSITFTVQPGAPELLYYVASNDINNGGLIKIKDIDENTDLDVANEIVGKKNYTTVNGLSLSNGMKVEFLGNVIPAKYAKGEWYVEGVGDKIKLVSETDLEVTSSYVTDLSIPFDANAFDRLPFDNASGYTGTKDYIVINRSSTERSPWSRHNRWFHRDVIEKSAAYNNQEITVDQSARASRPIIEFNAGLKLYSFGSQSKTNVDLVDTYTTDIFSTIEGSLGYTVDGIKLVNGMRVLFPAEKDIRQRGKIFKVSFITHKGRRQISLLEETDSTPINNETVLVLNGVVNKGKMFYYNGSEWQTTQEKTKVNQQPLFDLFDESGNSIGDTNYYPNTTFTGNKVFSYKEGTGSNDTELGFPLSYRSISNVGDIVFEFNLLADTFTYTSTPISTTVITNKTDTFSLQKYSDIDSFSYVNGWIKSPVASSQYVIRQYTSIDNQTTFEVDMYDNSSALTDLSIKVFVNNTLKFENVDYTVDTSSTNVKIIFTTELDENDIVLIKTKSHAIKNDNGLYEIPANFERNPSNDNIESFTLGEVNDHISTVVEEINNFSGVYPGKSNLRDLGNIALYGKKFVQHTGPVNLSLYHLTDKDTNIIKALEFNRREYAKFKRTFLQTSLTTGFDGTAKDHVDVILKELGQNRSIDMPFYFSDMAPSGGEKKITYTVFDTNNQFYALSQTHNNSILSVKSVTVYINNEQLIYGKDYTFNDEGFCVISKATENGDIIDIFEYETTDGSFIPPTPTKLGLYPKYVPAIYNDTSYITPRNVIQGHDGSKVVAFNDYRDDLLLELEKRIYNNIKISYDPTIVNIHEFIGGEDRNTGIYKKDVDNALITDFASWLASVGDVDYTENTGYVRGNSFTYNYSFMTSPSGKNLPGYWRAVYKQAYDTDRPHTHPWEMQGFFEKPSWWETVYGPAPYTKDNLFLWDDIKNGLIREPNKPVIIKEEYKRSNLTDHLPVDQNGNLVSPLESGYAQGFIANLTASPFVFGDEAPAETAWRRSSEYPFALLRAWCLNQPAKIMGLGFDRSRTKRNNAGQIVYTDTSKRINLANLKFPNNSQAVDVRVLTAGLVNFIANYLASNVLTNYTEYQNKLASVTNQLSFRLAGFTDKTKFNLILDSRTPLNQGNVFIPQENYSIILSQSSPTDIITYSGVVIERSPLGYIVRGYDSTNPVFKYYDYNVINGDPLVSIGGVSETFVEWSESKQYLQDQVVEYNDQYYRVKESHTSGQTFDGSKFTKLASLPTEGGREAIFRTSWTSEIKSLPYGTLLRTSQDVVDFLLGYQRYLETLGFNFEGFDADMQSIKNFRLSAKEFLFWTTQGWDTGSLISLSPLADGVQFKRSFTVIGDVFNNFFGYSIFKADGTKLKEDVLTVSRTDDEFNIRPKNTADGIYAIKLAAEQTEHVVILDNETEFKDVIYDRQAGYRQERIRVLGYRTADWNGSLNIPGFLYDSAEITLWEQYKDYEIGSIVKNKEFYYSAYKKVSGTQNFVEAEWLRLDNKPEAQLLTNINYKVTQFADFYDLDTDNFDVDQQEVAQHLIGYQKRDYLANIINDDVSQYKFYQGYIQDKGTKNALTKLFDALGAADKESLEFFEEWALRLGQYGAADGFDELEVKLDEEKFKLSPQPVQLTNEAETDNLVYNIPSKDVYLKPNNYDNSPFPTTFIPEGETQVRTAGYVRNEDIKYTVVNKDDILNIAIDDFNQGEYVWVTFEDQSWNVYKHIDSGFTVTGVTANGTTAVLSLDRRSSFTKDDIIGITNLTEFEGFFKVISSATNTVTVSTTITLETPITNSKGVLTKFVSNRVENLASANIYTQNDINAGELLWVDNMGDSTWGVLKNTASYHENLTIINPLEADSTNPLFGSSITATDDNEVIVVGAPNNEDGKVFVYTSDDSSASLSQELSPINGMSTVDSKFGESITMSPDGEYLIVAAPEASNVKSNFKDIFDASTTYPFASIVEYNNSLWKSRRIVKGQTSNVVFDTFDSAPQVKEYLLNKYNEFDSTLIYNVGNITTYLGDIYIATARSNPGARISANWEPVGENKNILTGDYPLTNTETDHILVRAPATAYEGSVPGDKVYFDWNEVSHAYEPIDKFEIIDIKFESVPPEYTNTTNVTTGIRLQTNLAHGLVDGDQILITDVPNDTISTSGFDNSDQTLPLNIVQNKGVTGLEYNKYYVKVASTKEVYLYTTYALDTLVNGTNNIQGAPFQGSAIPGGQFNGNLRKVRSLFDNRMVGFGCELEYELDGNGTIYNLTIKNDLSDPSNPTPIQGTGYTNPIIKITDTGTGNGATATATVTNGKITAVNLTAGGVNYTNSTISIEIIDTDTRVNTNWLTSNVHTIQSKVDEIFYILNPLNVPEIGDEVTTSTGNATVVYTKFELGKLIIYANNKNGVFTETGTLQISSTFRIGEYTRPAHEQIETSDVLGGYWKISLDTVEAGFKINPNARTVDYAPSLVVRDIRLIGDASSPLPYKSSIQSLLDVPPVQLTTGKVLQKQSHYITNISYNGNANTAADARIDLLSNKWLLRADKAISDKIIAERALGNNPQLGIWLNQIRNIDGTIIDETFSGLTSAIINDVHTVVDVWDGYVDVVLTNTTDQAQIGDILVEGTNGKAEIVYYQRDGNDARYYIKVQSGTFTQGADYGPAGAQSLPAYQIRKIDSQQVLSPVIGTSIRTSINDSTIGKLMVFEHSQNLPIPTRNRAIDLASFDSDVISGFDLEYFTWVQENRNGTQRLSLVPEVANNDWQKVYNIPVVSTGEASTFTNEGLFYVYQRNATTNDYDFVNGYILPNRVSSRRLGQQLKLIKIGNLYKLLINSKEGAGKIYTVLNGTGEDGTVYDWQLSKDTKFRGVYNSSIIYYIDDIVYYNGNFYKALTNIQGEAFTAAKWIQLKDHIDFVGAIPNTLGYKFADDSVLENDVTEFGTSFDVSDDGKTIAAISAYGALKRVAVYKFHDEHYELFQILEIPSASMEYGETISVADDGKLIAVGAPGSTYLSARQGQVFVYAQKETGYELIQTLVAQNSEPIENFGYQLSFDGNQLAVSSANGNIELDTTYDNDGTVFDNGFTNFSRTIIDSGSIYLYERVKDALVYGQQLSYRDFDVKDFGRDIIIKNDKVYVGLVNDTVEGTVGKVVQFEKDGVDIWSVHRTPTPQVDLNKFKGSFLYNTSTNDYLTSLDLIDPLQGKISGIAEQELSFKTYYDPATYTTATDTNVAIDQYNSWSIKNIGKVWWDLSTVKFLNPYQGDSIYSANTWNTLAPGASIDIYEWVETKLTPTQWDAQADTPAGIRLGISGKTKYGETAYCTRQEYDKISGTFTTKYYFWVKDKKTTPNIENRSKSAFDIAAIILDPVSQNLKFANMLSNNSFVIRNCDRLLENQDIAANFRYWTIEDQSINVHNEYQIISEGLYTSKPKSSLELKWFDSLIGQDAYGRPVPDPELSPKQKYGVLTRPRQSWFVNRQEAVQQAFTRINKVIKSELIDDNYNITTLLEKDPEPSAISKLWDRRVDTTDELSIIGTAKAQVATLEPVVIDGVVTKVNIITKGYSYSDPSYDTSIGGIRKGPKITAVGTGEGLELESTINALGQITSVTVINGGRNYADSLTLTVRPLSVLVGADSTLDGDWAIYGWDSATQQFIITSKEKYDVSDYWNYIDWYDTGFSQLTSIDYLVQETYELNEIDDKIGDIVKVENVGTGGWLLLEKTLNADVPDYTVNYRTIGRQNGTLQFVDTINNDSTNKIALRKILSTLRDNIFVGNLELEYNNLFFACLRYVFSEQSYVDWAFKTSFIKAKHNVGKLIQKTNYQNDNLPSFEEYVNEVKPYKTNIREYLSAYEGNDNTSSVITDYDLPAVYNTNLGKIVPSDFIVDNNQLSSVLTDVSEYPARHWSDNASYYIDSVLIKDGGSGYTETPLVTFVGGGGTGATAKAFIGNGVIKKIEITNPGTGYFSAPTIQFEGTQTNGTQPIVSVIIANGKVRATKIAQKFDRITTDVILADIQEQESFVATGSQLKFNTKWPLQLSTNAVNVTINGIQALSSQYSYKNIEDSTKGYTRKTGQIEFSFAPTKDSTVVITYNRSLDLLNAAERIQFLYEAQTGLYGKDFAQLMDGVDYGGVQVKSFEFGAKLGWDNDPWYASTWDSYDDGFQDEIITLDGSTTQITLSKPLENEVVYNVYLNGVRIDDPNFGTGNPVANPNAITQSITGDGEQTIIYTDNDGLNIAGEGNVIDPEYNNGAITDVTGDGSDFFKREVITNGVRIMGAGTVGGQTAVPNAWLEKVARMFELFTDPNGTGINEEYQRALIKTLSGDAGTYHAGFPTIQRVARGAGADYTPNFLTDSGVISWNLTNLFDTHVQNDMVWYLNSTGDGYGDGDIDAQEVIEHVFHTLHMHGLPADDIKLYEFLAADWQSGELYAAMEEAYDAGKWDPSGYNNPSNAWKTNSDAFEVAAKEYLFLLNFCMFEYTDLWEGGSLAPEWTDDMRTQVGILANNPLGYAFHNTYIAPVISRPSLATIRSIFQDGNTPAQDNPALAGTSGYVVDVISSSGGLDAGDTIIVRKASSDGSFLPDTFTLDTVIEGGNLAYGTATGLKSEDITIDGDGFVTPTTSKGPEELVPGQVLDTLDIKVYDKVADGGSAIAIRNYTASAAQNTTFDLSILPHNVESLLVKVDNIIQGPIDDSSYPYEIDFVEKTLTFNDPLNVGQRVSIISMGGNGENILDIDNFIADGSTQIFVTNVLWNDNISTYISIDGKKAVAEIFETDSTYDGRAGLVGIKFITPPEANSYIYYAVYASTSLSYSEVTVDRFEGDGSSVGFTLSTPPTSSLPLSHNVVVKVDNKILYPGYNQQFIISPSREYTFDLHQVARASVSPENIAVYLNDIQLTYLQDFNWDFNNSAVVLFDNIGTTGDTLDVFVLNDGEYEFDRNIELTLDSDSITGQFSQGEELRIGSADSTQHEAVVKTFTGNVLTAIGDSTSIIATLTSDPTIQIEGLSSGAIATAVTGFKGVESGDRIILTDTPAIGSKVDVYKFNKHDIQNIERITQDIITRSTLVIDSDDYYEYNKLTQGLVELRLPAVDPAYLWVSLNGQLLTANVDYTVTENLKYLKVTKPLLKSDRLDIVHFAGNRANDKFGFRIFKDMLNRTHYKRLNSSKIFVLDQDLNYFDKDIKLVNATGISQPDPSINVPGVVFIDGERIEYFKVDGNVLSQLRRGTLGTGVKSVYNAGEELMDQSTYQTVPYTDEIRTLQYEADGSTATYALDWATTNVNEFEVFVAGKRLRKQSIEVFDTTIDQDSPEADITVDAEFTISSNTITLNTIPVAGTKVFIIRKIGKSWQESGESLRVAQNPIAEFLRDQTIDLPK